MPDELKPCPCPFCGGEAEIRKLGMFDSAKARCTSAECFIQRRTWAIDLRKWNTRPIEDALRAENARMKEQIEEASRDKITLSEVLIVDSYTADIDLLRVENERIIKVCQNTSSQLWDACRENNRLEAENAKLKARVAELEKAIEDGDLSSWAKANEKYGVLK